MGMIYEPTFKPGDILPASVVNNIIKSIKEDEETLEKKIYGKFYINKNNFPSTGVSETIYIDKESKIMYCWNEQNKKYESLDIIENRDKYIKTKLPEAQGGIITLENNIEYFIGEEKELNIKFPTNSNIGDYIFLKFESGDVATNLTIVQDNIVGNTEIIPKQKSIVEIYGSYNGSMWLIQYLIY